jgi:N-acyl-D-aspartate/D-glutamate deacylase
MSLSGSDLGRVDLLIEHGTVIDGSGSGPVLADVVVRSGRILAVAEGLGARVEAGTVLDARGLTVAPGFVDIHGHSDLSLLSAPHAPSKLLQGVTTEVIGNCGMAVAPVAPGVDRALLRTALASGDADPTVEWDWDTMAGYRRRLDLVRPAMNVGVLTGHLPIRVGALGYSDRAATIDELTTMQVLLDEALKDGAVGLSTGLSLPPMSYSDGAELEALGEVVAAHGSLFTFHMREYTSGLLSSVEEVLAVARRTGCRVQVSHLVVIGRDNWGSVARALEMIDRAREEGVDVAADVYPYIAGSGNLTQLFPDWALEGGRDAQLERLRDADELERIVAAIGEKRLTGSWDDIIIAGGAFADLDVVGRSLPDIAREWGSEPERVAAVLSERSGMTGVMVAFGRSEEDLIDALQHPAVMIGSDGRGLDPEGPTGVGKPHPRAYGCYPRLLGRYVREQGHLSLPEAIRKSTSQPAERFGFGDRGRVAPGLVADLVVLDASTVTDVATFEDPHRFPVGVPHVFVSGEHVVADGMLTGARPGVVL